MHPADFYKESEAPDEIINEIEHFLTVDDREYEYGLADAINDIWDMDECDKYLDRKSRRYLRELYIKAGQFKPLDIEKFQRDVETGFAPYINGRVASLSYMTDFTIKGVRYTGDEDYQAKD